MSSLQPVRGTHDLLPEEFRKHRYIGDLAADVSLRYGYQEMATPIFEFSEVFTRTLGEASDIVTKERYTFTDRGGDELTLRPEGTASVARAVISQGLFQNLPLKFFYRGPMFRYERPQKGRQRQFHQMGVELLGVAGWQGDVEVISLAHHILSELKINDLTRLEINTLGDTASRNQYRQNLVDYFSRYEKDLSADSQVRLKRNPLRILDSKDEKDKKLIVSAPKFSQSLNAESKTFFESVQKGLQALNIPFHLNERLVRGLDYYSHSVFEFVTQALGAQDAVLSGGRYDGLMEQMGGTPTPGVGWAAGIERLALLIKELPELARPVALVPLGEAAELKCLEIAEQLRKAGFFVDIGYSGNLQKRMKRANKVQAWAALILGDNEITKGEITLKLLDSGEQKTIATANLISHLQSQKR